MINLITSFFRPENTERLNELVVCLKNNIDCKYIKKIYLFMENKEDIVFLKQEIKTTRNKIQLILWKKQPTYADHLNLSNQLKGEICMISNADIWLKTRDTDLINLVKTNKNIGYALTRHEYDMSCPLIDTFSPRQMSFDSFIFKSPIYIDLKLINHQQNRMGSENVFKRELENIGIVFYNPCKDIVIVHEHKSGIRNYGESLLYATLGKKIKSIYNKKLIYSPVISKKQLLNIIMPPQPVFYSGKIFKIL
jgi:hypothetical protein|tara:strand:- start:41 stop:793 length:753 start_codon:yes stop_codon:yes gene_type:complete